MVAPARTRAAIAVELAALVAGVVVGGRWGLIALLGGLTLALALHGRRWFDPVDHDGGAGWSALGGALVGALALAAALALSPSTIEWGTTATVRGSASQLAIAAVPTLVGALAAELAFRRWLLERVAAIVRGAGEPALAAQAAGIVVAAMVEAAVLPAGDAGGFGRLGTALAGGGLGFLYVSAGGRLPASLAARGVFELGALALQALRLI